MLAAGFPCRVGADPAIPRPTMVDDGCAKVCSPDWAPARSTPVSIPWRRIWRGADAVVACQLGRWHYHRRLS